MSEKQKNDLWKQIKHDRKCAIIVLSAIGAGLCMIVTWINLLLPLGPTVRESRHTPPYLLLMFPFVYWAVQLAWYHKGAVKVLRPTVIGIIVMSAVSYIFAKTCGDMNIFDGICILPIISVSLAAVSLFFFKGSLLDSKEISF